MKKENVEIFEEENVITLYDEEENPVEFYEIACVELNDKYYGLMQPVEPMEGLGEDEAVIFEIQQAEDGSEEDFFVPLYDEEILEAVFNEYMKAVSSCECGCGECDCDDCGEECGDDCDCEDHECSCHHHEK